MNKYVDLHIHSMFSDGTMTPEEIIEEAIRSNVYTIAITDHNNIDGSRGLLKYASNKNIECISGVELDAVTEDMNYHILAYGFNLDDERFCDRVRFNNYLLEEVNNKLIRKMEKVIPQITSEEYAEFSYDRMLGGWKALHYFVHKEITKSLSDGFSVYEQFDHSYTCVDFPRVDEVCNWIHEAGGKAILAHPGRVIQSSDNQVFADKLRNFIDLGVDGIECYYPSHSEKTTNICIEICKRNDLIITGGSDCHGSFENTAIGQNRTLYHQITTERLQAFKNKL